MTTARRVLTQLHGWLGVTSALFIILVAGSGAALAFVGELFLAQYGDVLRAAPPSTETRTADVSSLITSATAGYGDTFQAMGILMPHSRIEEVETAMVFGMPIGNHASEGVRILSVNPWTANYQGDFPLSGAFGHELLDFHHGLLLGEPGIVFVCVLAIALLGFAVSGIYLWWPKQGSAWRKTRRVTLRGGPKTAVFSLHGWFGVWLALLIAYFSISGLALSKPGWFGPLLSAPTFAPPSEAGFDKICGDKITPDAAADAGASAFPERTLATFFLPNRKDGPYMLTYKSSGDGNLRDGDARIFVHASCQGLVHKENAKTTATPRRLSNMMLSMHGGYSFGKPVGDILVVLAGVGLFGLAGTGVFVFFTRTRRNTRVRQKREAASSVG